MNPIIYAGVVDTGAGNIDVKTPILLAEKIINLQ